MDSRFRVKTLRATEDPQQLVWLALHQDYSEDSVIDCMDPPCERVAGEIAVKRLLAGERGHYGCLEHPQISLAVAGFPHSVMQQARTHRVGISFDVQSGRYTGKRIIDLAEGRREIEDVFYLRPAGEYHDRKGKSYQYTEDQRKIDSFILLESAVAFRNAMERGMSEEHARDMIPYAIRQDFVVSFNLRSALHFMDLRGKADAQLEIVQLSQLLWPCIQQWTPEIAAYYTKHRLGKARLAP